MEGFILIPEEERSGYLAPKDMPKGGGPQ